MLIPTEMVISFPAAGMAFKFPTLIPHFAAIVLCLTLRVFFNTKAAGEFPPIMFDGSHHLALAASHRAPLAAPGG